MSTTQIFRLGVVVAVLAVVAGSARAADDYWTPRGAPMTDEGRTKTLDMVEPRTEIVSIPYVISRSGSYYLAGAMSGAPGSNGITILCNDVKLDLNGFSMIGGPDSLNGIVVGATVDNIAVRNGALRNWGQYGLDARYATDSGYHDVKAYGNGLAGLVIGENSLVSGCSAYGNGFSIDTFPGNYSDGMLIKEFSTVVDCKSRHNRGSGFNVYRAVKLTGCTAAENMHMGVYGWTYCTVRDCLITRNYSHGIAVYGNCRVEMNNCGENGAVWSGNEATYGRGAGVSVYGSASRIENNNVADNDYGIWVQGTGQGNLIVQNSASGNVYSDFLTSSSGDYVGYLCDTNDLTNGGTSGFMVDNPWANFQF